MIWVRPEYGLVSVLGIVLCSAAALGLWRIQRRAAKALHPTLVPPWMRTGIRSRLLLGWLAVAAWMIALAGPTWGTRTETPDVVYKDVILAVDFSRSVYAEDIAPSRQVYMRNTVARLMQDYPTYRYSLLLFAGDAWMRVPYTFDRDYILWVLDHTRPEDLKPQGTDIHRVLSLAIKQARDQGRQETTMVLLTDGEHNGESDPMNVIALLRKENIRLLTVSVGDPGGAPIPAPGGGYVKDAQGEIVFSRADWNLLAELARQTNGIATSSHDTNNHVAVISNAMQAIEGKRQDQVQVLHHIDRSLVFVAIGWLLLFFAQLPLGWHRLLFQQIRTRFAE